METKREFYEAVIALEAGEVSEFAQAQIEKLDAMNAKRRSAEKKPSKASIENEAYVTMLVMSFLGAEPKTASEAAAFLDVKVQKASAVLRQAVNENKAVATDVKVKGKGTAKGYTLV